MAERVTGPYRGYYISASARLTASHEAQPHGDRGAPPTGAPPAGAPPIYVGSVSLAAHGPDNAHRFEALVDLGEQQRFESEEEALEHVERAAREYIDRLLQKGT